MRDEKGRFAKGHCGFRLPKEPSPCSQCGIISQYCKRLCKKCYHKIYSKNTNSIQRIIDWKKANPELEKESDAKYRATHRGQILEQQRRFYARNLEKFKERRLKNIEKIKARRYANDHKQKREFCERCGDDKKLHFHHTNYKENKGITLCSKCHWLEHHQPTRM